MTAKAHNARAAAIQAAYAAARHGGIDAAYTSAYDAAKAAGSRQIKRDAETAVATLAADDRAATAGDAAARARSQAYRSQINAGLTNAQAATDAAREAAAAAYDAAINDAPLHEEAATADDAEIARLADLYEGHAQIHDAARDASNAADARRHAAIFREEQARRTEQAQQETQQEQTDDNYMPDDDEQRGESIAQQRQRDRDDARDAARDAAEQAAEQARHDEQVAAARQTTTALQTARTRLALAAYAEQITGSYTHEHPVTYYQSAAEAYARQAANDEPGAQAYAQQAAYSHIRSQHPLVTRDEATAIAAAIDAARETYDALRTELTAARHAHRTATTQSTLDAATDRLIAVHRAYDAAGIATPDHDDDDAGSDAAREATRADYHSPAADAAAYEAYTAARNEGARLGRAHDAAFDAARQITETAREATSAAYAADYQHRTQPDAAREAHAAAQAANDAHETYKDARATRALTELDERIGLGSAARSAAARQEEQNARTRDADADRAAEAAYDAYSTTRDAQGAPDRSDPYTYNRALNNATSAALAAGAADYYDDSTTYAADEPAPATAQNHAVNAHKRWEQETADADAADDDDDETNPADYYGNDPAADAAFDAGNDAYNARPDAPYAERDAARRRAEETMNDADDETDDPTTPSRTETADEARRQARQAYDRAYAGAIDAGETPDDARSYARQAVAAAAAYALAAPYYRAALDAGNSPNAAWTHARSQTIAAGIDPALATQVLDRAVAEARAEREQIARDLRQAQDEYNAAYREAALADDATHDARRAHEAADAAGNPDADARRRDRQQAEQTADEAIARQQEAYSRLQAASRAAGIAAYSNDHGSYPDGPRANRRRRLDEAPTPAALATPEAIEEAKAAGANRVERATREAPHDEPANERDARLRRLAAYEASPERIAYHILGSTPAGSDYQQALAQQYRHATPATAARTTDAATRLQTAARALTPYIARYLREQTAREEQSIDEAIDAAARRIIDNGLAPYPDDDDADAGEYLHALATAYTAYAYNRSHGRTPDQAAETASLVARYYRGSDGARAYARQYLPAALADYETTSAPPAPPAPAPPAPAPYTAPQPDPETQPLPEGHAYHNEPERVWANAYHVYLSPIVRPLLINADNAEDAGEEAFDYERNLGHDYDPERDADDVTIARVPHPVPVPAEEQRPEGTPPNTYEPYAKSSTTRSTTTARTAQKA